MKDITIKFSDGEKPYNQQLIRNILEDGKFPNKKLDTKNLTSKIHERIKRINLELVSGERFYKEIQYELARRNHLEEAELYQILADVEKDYKERR